MDKQRKCHLPNRQEFFSSLRQALASGSRCNQSVALLLIDLDRFKNINDNLGHAVGDRVLAEFSHRLAIFCDRHQIVARLGGDEFGMILTIPTNSKQASNAAVCIAEVFSHPVVIDDHFLSVTASIGIALYPENATHAGALLQYADIAMYRAKASGRNTYRFFSPEMNERGLELLAMEIALRKAMQRGEFHLVYQPKMHVKTGTVTGVEALLRWERDGHGLMLPSDFIPLLEETGLILEIGAWVITTACRQLRTWMDEGIDGVTMSVNVSPRQFQDARLETAVRTALAQNAIPPSMLEIEITENIVMESSSNTVAYLKGFRDMGISISIDDFGTGYSSLGYLKNFPVDCIKIDITFIRDVVIDAGDAAITLAIINLAHGLGLSVIAEGVETRAQLEFLRRHECDQIQGFLCCRPLAPEDMRSFFERHRRMSLRQT